MVSSTLSSTDFDQFVAKLPYPPNRFQQDILKSIASGEGNILVNALAGSGKTSLLIQCAELLTKMGVSPSSAMFLAFNVKIRDEMNERLPSGWTAINSHRLGMLILKKTQPATSVDYKKWFVICDALVKSIGFMNNSFTAAKLLENLCSKAMLNNEKLVDLTQAEALALPDKLRDLAAHYSLDGGEDDTTGKSIMLDQLIPLVPKALAEGKKIWESAGKISFDEMIYWPIALDLPLDTYQYVFVDECQDLNSVQQQLAIRSCAPGGRMIFVGDAKQSVYGFAAADAAGFYNIKNLINAQVLPLNICYRCPTSHLDLARSLVKEIEAGPAAIPGIIEYAASTEAHKIMGRGSLIMCRLTAPLVEMYFSLIEQFATRPKAEHIPVKMLGRDIAAMLGSILDKIYKMPAFNYSRISEFLAEYEQRQSAFLIQKQANESQITQLEDSIRVLQVCVENFRHCATIQCLKSDLKSLFGDDTDKGYNARNFITLLTIHRAKGLEAEHTAILKPDKMPLVWNGQQPWEFEQEQNILYVALTRSKDKLTVFGVKDSLNVTATYDDAARNTRRITDFEETVIIEDITDVLPDKKIAMPKENTQQLALLPEPLAETIAVETPSPVISELPEVASEVEPPPVDLDTLEKMADEVPNVSFETETQPLAILPPKETVLPEVDKKPEIDLQDKSDREILDTVRQQTSLLNAPFAPEPAPPKLSGDLKKDLKLFKEQSQPANSNKSEALNAAARVPVLTKRESAQVRLVKVLDSISDIKTIDTLIELLQARKEMLQVEN